MSDPDTPLPTARDSMSASLDAADREIDDLIAAGDVAAMDRWLRANLPPCDDLDAAEKGAPT